MNFVFSPAKKLDLEGQYPACKEQDPILLKNAKKVASVLKTQDTNKLQKLMKLSKDLAQLNAQRHASWGKSKNQKRPAIYTFKGDTYIGFNVAELSSSQVNQANKQLFILSGLYGVLRALDQIEAYRLEMGTKLEVNEKKSLPLFWKQDVTQILNNSQHKSPFLINLASKEYFQSIDTNSLNLEVITPHFKINKNGKLGSLGMMSKRARGMMGRFIIQTKASKLKDLHTFNLDGYQFSKNDLDSKLQAQDILFIKKA